jgi:hypothetical protein
VWRVVSQTLVTSMSTTLPNRCDSLTNLLSAFLSSWGNSHKHIEYTSQQVEIVLQTYRVLLPTTGNGLTNISSTPLNSWGWSYKPIEKLPNRLSKLTNLSDTLLRLSPSVAMCTRCGCVIVPLVVTYGMTVVFSGYFDFHNQ